MALRTSVVASVVALVVVVTGTATSALTSRINYVTFSRPIVSTWCA